MEAPSRSRRSRSWLRGCLVEPRYTLRMKRTNLVLDAALLEEATRLSGEKTYSAAVSRALEAFVRHRRAWTAFDALRGSGAWQGDLATMRGDRRRGRRR